MKRTLSHLGITALTLVAGQVLVAQSTTTGAVNGVVTDKAGAPVAGALVTIASGQITRTAVTGADGRYNAGLLNPGPVMITVAKSGFLTSKQKVNINIDSAVTANFKVAKEGSAVVEVVATASNIDTSSTTTGSNFTMQDLADLPKGRDIGDVAFMTPGVTTSGFNASDGLGLNISISGASGAENSFKIDGLSTNDMRYGGQGVTMTQEFVDQIEVQTGGFKPEFSSMGGVFNVTTKSGGNNFAGSAWVDVAPSALTPAAKQTMFFKEAAPVSTYELGALASGAIIKDKFFYAVGLNWLQVNTPSSANLSGNSIGSISSPDYQFFSKFNYFINTDNQLTLAYFGHNRDAKQSAGGTLGSTADGRGNQNTAGDTIATSSNINLTYDATLTPTLFMSIKVGQSNLKNQTKGVDQSPEIIDYTYYKVADGSATFLGGPGAGAPGTQSGSTRWVSGGYGDEDYETNKATQYSLDFTYILGDHSLKAGYSDMTSQYIENEHRSGPDNAVWYVKDSGGNAHISKRVYTNQSEANAEFQALYLQDTWQVNKGLNIFYGARAEHQIQKGNNGQAFMDFGFGKYIQPRLGFTWDTNGDSTSKVSGSVAKYYEQIPQRMAIRTYGNEFYQQYYYYNALGTGYNGTASIPWQASYATAPWTAVATQPATNQIVNYSTGWSHDPLADGIKLPQRVEVQLGYDKQVSATTTLGLHGRYRKLTNPMEDSEIVKNDGSGTPIDPADNVGGQAIIWNPGNSVTWTSPFSGQKVSATNTGYPVAYNEYKAVDFSYTYKTSRNMLFIGYTWSRFYGNYEGLISPSNGQADGNITASYDYQPYVGTGLMPTDHEHSVKAYGFQKFPIGEDSLQVGFNFLAMSGSPISKQDNGDSTYGVGLGDPGGYGNATFVGGLAGNYGRTPTVYKLDLNANYQHAFSKTTKMAPFVELYNVLNARPALSVVEQTMDATATPYPTGKWGSATSFQTQRTLRFGVRVNF